MLKQCGENHEREGVGVVVAVQYGADVFQRSLPDPGGGQRVSRELGHFRQIESAAHRFSMSRGGTDI